jgi:hypothetical protein
MDAWWWPLVLAAGVWVAMAIAFGLLAHVGWRLFGWLTRPRGRHERIPPPRLRRYEAAAAVYERRPR